MITWILNHISLGLLYVLRFLPISVNHFIGDMIGTLAFYLPIERKRVVDINLKLCFPDMTDLERKTLALKNWKLFGRSMTERGYLWLGSKEQINRLVQFESDVNLQDGQPRILFSMHLHGIEAGLIAGSIYATTLGLKSPMTLYIKMKNDFFDTRIKKWRERFGAKMVLRQQNARHLIRAIRDLQTVVLSPDMDLGRQDSVFVSFFGIPTCTVTSISGFAKLSNAQVCPMVTTLNEDGKSYTCHVYPALENFPSDNELLDTQRLSDFFESQIKARPQEYYWVHKRFKNRPDGQARFY
jgi:Kdo2-lipid IVA lauroyltransferase/acyltransferase